MNSTVYKLIYRLLWTKNLLSISKNGGKFLYCENLTELKEQFENILEENDWFEKEAVCYEPKVVQYVR